MTLNEILPIIINGSLLVFGLALAVVIFRASSRYTYNFGDDEVQGRMKWIILRSLMALLVIGIVAAAYNIFFAQ